MTDNEQDFAPNSIFLPIIFKRGNQEGDAIYNHLTGNFSDKIIVDQFIIQKKEFLKIKYPSKNISPVETDQLYNNWCKPKIEEEEGCWVYYPWLNKLIHILDKDEFIELRTNRNHYKITPQEQKALSERSIGIIGLSVGHSVAITLATERTCGTLKLADFDTIELSNLNRIKTGIQNIGLNKCIVTAREIAEIDPFITLDCYTEGLDAGSIEDFLLSGKKLDILIDECDDLKMKIVAREHAKKHNIPVVMETSDRGMVDVERFDFEPERPILHGLLKDFPMERLNTLTNEQKVPLILKIVDVRNGSARGKASMLEVGQTISTWPQLASAVTLGGGIVTDVCRRMLLNEYKESGRYYVDLEEIVCNKETIKSNKGFKNPYLPFDWKRATDIAKEFIKSESKSKVPGKIIKSIIEAATQAPSTGNDQPWKWICVNDQLYLFHDQYRSWSFGNFHNIASNISFGAAYANLEIRSKKLGYTTRLRIFPSEFYHDLIAIVQLIKVGSGEKIEEVAFSKEIATRCTNRNPSEAVAIPEGHFEMLKQAAGYQTKANVLFITDRDKLSKIGRIIAECDRIRIFNPSGHEDFVEREMKWTKADAERTRDGIDITTLGMNPAQLAAMSIIKEKEVIEILSQIQGGEALLAGTVNTVMTSSAIGIITVPKYCKESFFEGGIAMERLWLQAEALGYAIHPLISPFYLFPRVVHANGIGLNDQETDQLKILRKKFLSIVSLTGNDAEVFIFKIAKAPKPTITSFRLPTEETLFHIKSEMK